MSMSCIRQVVAYCERSYTRLFCTDHLPIVMFPFDSSILWHVGNTRERELLEQLSESKICLDIGDTTKTCEEAQVALQNSSLPRLPITPSLPLDIRADPENKESSMDNVAAAPDTKQTNINRCEMISLARDVELEQSI